MPPCAATMSGQAPRRYVECAGAHQGSLGEPHDRQARRWQMSQTLRFATADLETGLRLRYAEQGDPTGPAIILLHGYSDSWFSWSEVLPRLSPAYHVFALDQRGHGDSERPADGYGVSDFAADVLAFMNAAGLPTATVVGHSMGSR